MFFKKKPTVIYLQKENFLVYAKNHPDGIEFAFPQHSIKNNQLANPNKFVDGLNTFVAENLIDIDRYILVLSPDIFSQKKLDTLSAEDQQKEVEKFIKDSDIKEEFLVKETYELDNSRYVFAADKRFYENVVSLFANLSWSTMSVIPVSLFRDILDTKMKKSGLSQRELKDILDNEKLVTDANIVPYEIAPAPLASVEPETPSEEKAKEEPVAASAEKEKETTQDSSFPLQKQQSFLNTSTIILASLGILLIGGVAFLYTQGTLGSLLSMKSSVREVKQEPTPKPSPTPTPTEVEKDKSKLTVQVQNGTGVVGQAARVKTRLSALEYEGIETKNADSEDNTETLITFSPKVPKEYQDEIVKDLKKIFETVKSEVKEDQEKDIVILTGTEK